MRLLFSDDGEDTTHVTSLDNLTRQFSAMYDDMDKGVGKFSTE